MNHMTSKNRLAVIAVVALLIAAAIPAAYLYFLPAPSDDEELDSYEGVIVDKSRTVKVRFVTNVHRDLPWSFEVEESVVDVHPGERRLVKFVSENLSDRSIEGRAVYEIEPLRTHESFKKVECFCFEYQTLEAGQRREMPLYFWFDPELPEDVTDITIYYTFYNVDSSVTRSQANE